MRIICISNFKGGVGKTTTATNLSYNLASLGFKVLLVDADPQGNSSYFYGKYDELKVSLADVLTRVVTAKKAIVRTKYNNLDILPSNKQLDGLTKDKENAEFNGFELGVCLKSIGDKYDFCVVDCQPSFQINTISALNCADDVIIPVRLGRYAINGLELMSEMIEKIKEVNPDIKYRVMVTMWKQNINSNKKTIVELVNEYNYPLYSTGIRCCVAVDECENNRRPLARGRKTSSVTADYFKFTSEYLGYFFSEENWQRYITDESMERAESICKQLHMDEN